MNLTKNMIIVDTGFWLALANKKDAVHISAKKRFQDLADSSLVILAEELGHGQILSVDYRDFNTYRWKNTEPFDNLFHEFL
ncbi:MAG: hypothetical protein ACFCUV_03735 [Rivularia sp. (in: cyanobacteria)]